jgi:alpha-L-fucosidase
MDTIDAVIAGGPFQADWESLKRYTIPQWYADARFGIFIHWGLYAVPAFGNEWYPRNMYVQGSAEFDHHLAVYGPQDQFGYKDFIPRFTAEAFDAPAWADLFKRSGARYVIPVAEHHDGFAMYASSFSRWNAREMGPQRDLIGEIAAAVRQQGLVFGVSSHRAEHWWFMNGGRQFPSDVQDPRYADFYGPAQPEGTQPDPPYLDDWLARTCQLVDAYRPQVVWFDWWIEQPVFQPYLQKFAAYYYNRGVQWGQQVAINYKNQAFPAGTAIFDVERGQLAGIRDALWQTDTSISKNSWGYVKEQDYKTAASLLGDLVDIVSKNGVLLLNVGPRPDGTIPQPEQEILLEMGEWLALNGEAIYGSRPWKVFGEGPTQVGEGSFTDTQRPAFTGQDIRFTTRDGALYAILLAWSGESVSINSLGTSTGLWDGPLGGLQLLGHPGQLEWQRDEQSLTVRLPGQPPCKHAYVLKITQ